MTTISARLRNRTFYKNHRDKILEYHRKYNKIHREQLKAHRNTDEYRKNHREYMKIYYKLHPEKLKEVARRHQLKYPYHLQTPTSKEEFCDFAPIELNSLEVIK